MNNKIQKNNKIRYDYHQPPTFDHLHPVIEDLKFEENELTISPRAKSKIDRIDKGNFTDKAFSQSQIIIPKIDRKFKHKPKKAEVKMH